MILKISFRAKAGVPKTIETKTSPTFPVFPSENVYLMLTESRGQFSDLNSIFRLCAPRYSFQGIGGDKGLSIPFRRCR